MGLISVIVPVYNPGPFLRPCLDSILGQQGADCELIIVDDGSDDGSGAVCSEYGVRYGGKVRVLTRPHGGLSASRNAGIAAARGEYICFVDSDDMLLPGALMRLKAMLETHDCGIAAGQLTRTPKNTDIQGNTSICNAEEAIINTLYQKRLFDNSACGKLYRRTVFEVCSEWFVAGRHYEDLEAYPRLLRAAGHIAVTDASVYYYRPNPASFIHRWTESRKDVLWATERVGEFVAEYFPKAGSAARSRRFSAVFNMFVAGTRNNDRALAASCMDEIRTLRTDILADNRVRFKNRLGALVSYAGEDFLKLLAKLGR